MKKIFILAAVLTIAACSDLSSYTTTDSNSSVKARMNACMLSEAQTKLQNGTLFTSGIKDTASTLVSTCTKKLALQSMGISEESQTAAENIISNLKTLSN